MSGVLVVCPSVTAEHAERFCAAARAAIDDGADLRAVLVANDAGTQALAARYPELVVAGSNAGFAASINQGAAAGSAFRWLVIANDDYDHDADRFGRLAAHLAGEPAGEPRLLRLTGELPWRRLPGVAGVFANLSLLDRVAAALGHRLRTAPDAPSDPRLYAPLALVAVSAALWQATGGLEEALPFCYEDAWFARRARAAAPGFTLGTFDLGLRHQVSSSTTSRIDVVLPVITWSALAYLRMVGVPAPLARATCLLALLVRVPLSLAARAGRGRHLRGIARSAAAVVGGRRPSLPAP